MQQPPINDHIRWLRLQESQLVMEEAQLAAEEQWLQQEIWKHNNNTGARFGQAILHGLTKNYRPTSWQRHGFWLRHKGREFESRRIALRAKRNWLQQEKAKYGLP
jgi:hypothetical protein